MRQLALLILTLLPALAPAADWPQFHGPNASGIAPDNLPLPDKIGPNDNLIWKTPLPPGHSSPIVAGDRIYLTGVRDKEKLITIALDRATGKIVWEREARVRELEKIHTVGSHAQSTCAANADMVVSFFGSSGLYAYDKNGKELWFQPFGPFPNDFGAGSSPILIGDTVILCQDHDTGSFLMALDAKNGTTKWKTDRSEFPRNYATPIVWDNGGKKQLVIAATLRAVGYDIETGEEVWTVRGLARIINMTPLIGPDGNLYLAAWSPGGDPGERIEVGPWTESIKKWDKNGDRKLVENEVPDGPIKQRFTQVDRDKDGFIVETEYEGMRKVFTDAQNRMIAVKPGGKGDITNSHVLWSQPQGKYLPYVPSPLVYNGTIFLVKNGGLLTSLDPKTGKMIKNERIFGSPSYYASPVGGDGKVYTVSERGHINIIKAEADWEVLHQSKLDEDVFSTPAIADGRIYIRTSGFLYCFGLPAKK